MSVLSDRWIKKMAIEKEMIKPFVSEQKSSKNISYGLSSYGYDARVSNEFKIFTDLDSVIVDPKNFKKNRNKLKNLLSEDIPEGFINRQLNDSRYISKLIKGLLSNLVREDNEQEAHDGQPFSF